MTTTARESVRSFVAWVSRRDDSRDGARDGIGTGEGRTWSWGGLTVSWAPRSMNGGRPEGSGLPTLLVGDDSEWLEEKPDLNMAGGVSVRFDASAGSLIVCTSMVGLPPIYLYRGANVTALASDIHLLRDLPGVILDFDGRSVAELGQIGHPVEHRTLFRDVSLVPSGAILTLHTEGDVDIRDTWALAEQERLEWPEFIESQVSAFTESVRRADLTNSFLSLTAGLDTRTVFATLAEQGRLVPAATMTGVRRSLDARTAARLCAAYDVPHHAVVFDDRFRLGLPRYVETASLLSGGLSSLDQAPEVYFYDVVDGQYTARLSGNLGNQVGRGGTEGVSTRGADTGILSADLRSTPAGSSHSSGHWLLDKLGGSERARLEFILKNEIPFTLVNNYTIGNHYAKQQTPYASRALIETLARRPAAGTTAPSGSMIRMRLRDLSHRFLGESEAYSFQRTLLRRLGGFTSRYPINWGWRAAGGVSPTGLAMGSATLVGMYARAKGLDGGLLGAPMAWSGLPALHDFRESRRWLRDGLRDFTHDTVGSRGEAALFDRAVLDRVLNEHFTGRRDHYRTVTFALDVALAHRIFVAPLSV